MHTSEIRGSKAADRMASKDTIRHMRGNIAPKRPLMWRPNSFGNERKRGSDAGKPVAEATSTVAGRKLRQEDLESDLELQDFAFQFRDEPICACPGCVNLGSP